MDHTQYKEQLSALLDDELGDAARADVTAHLAECEACQAYFAELAALRDALNEPDGVEIPANFADGVLARLHSGEKPVNKRRAWRGLTALAACVAAVVLAINTLPRAGSAGSKPAPAEGGGSMPAAAQAMPADVSTETAAENWMESKMLFMTSGADEAPAEAAAEELSRDTGIAAEYGATEPDAALTLSGEGAAVWLAENAEPLGEGRWRVSVEAVRVLPDTLSLTGLQEPVDGALIVTLETPEEP